ncbi:MAG: hypothetical protein IPH45_21070 [Bacteroidales bacterium]|nr:hypothetical protein [Bacteroidales bacterium]
MKYPVLLIIFLVFTSGIKSQSIIAGQHDVKDYYKDFNPDTVIWCLTGHLCSHLETPIDMNADGITDITFISGNAAGAMGYEDNYVKIKAHSNSQVASGSLDSCHHLLGKVFLNNDTIQSSCSWSNETLDLKLKSSMVGGWSCYASASPSYTFILWYQGFAYNDTLYGWIQIYNVYIDSWDAHFTIQEYACNKGSVGLSEYGNDNFLHIFPNPCKDRISIELETPAKQALAILSDINGKELIRQLFEY